VISCTAPLSQIECAQAQDHFARPVLQSYGLSETLIVSIEACDRDVSTDFSAGSLIAGPSSASVQSDGRLLIKNGAVFPGYASMRQGKISLKLPDMSQPGEFLSSDLAEIENGKLAIIGRDSSVINIGGMKISGEALERVLCNYPGIEAAAVSQRFDSRGIEKPVAMIVCTEPISTTALFDFCASSMGVAARPAEVKIVNDLPRTANGKVDRSAVHAILNSAE
jgi:acyl-coenzyme A synthetase/AMP-(fatty) acid ligase